MVPAALAFGLGVLVTLLQGSLFEWVYHRYWLHRPWLPPHMFTAHTLVHHQLCKHDDTFHVHDEEQEEALTFQWWAGPVLVAINVLPWIGLWVWMRDSVPFAVGAGFVSGFLVTMVSYYFAYEGFHYLMHKPSIPWIERSRMFRFLEKHHRIHHAHMGRNFNVVLPIADLFLGTLMLRDPLAPRRTEPAARQVARRHSRYGKKLAAETGLAQQDGAADVEALAESQDEAPRSAPLPMESARRT